MSQHVPQLGPTISVRASSMEHGVDCNETFDVVVVGSGIAGLATALAAREFGLRPVVLEKATKVGGGTAFANGGIWIGNNHLMRAAGYDDSRDAVLAYMRFIAGDQAVEENLLAFVDRGPEVLKFFEDCGIAFRISRGLSDHYYDSAPGSVAEGRCLNVDFIAATDLGSWEDKILVPRDTPLDVNSEELIAWGGITNIDHWPKDIMADRRRRRIRTRGVGVVMHFVKQLLRRAVPIKLAANVDQLVVERGRVAGVALTDGTRIGAERAVMLATGAYESNPKLAKTYEGLPGWLSMFPPTIQGDGIVMASEIGAQVRTIHNNMALFLGFNIPGQRPGEEPLFRLVGISEMLCPHTIVVNKDGRRFADESYFQAMVPSLRSYLVNAHRHANLPCYLVFDQQYADGFSFAGRPRGSEIPAWVKRADTLDALAPELGIDPAALGQTVATFNEFARAGVDTDFGRGKRAWSLARKDQWKPTRADERYVNPSLGTLRIAPFYGVELHPSAFASAGLLTNACAQVINQRQQPIPGLYAAGNATAHTEYGVGYQAGHSFAAGMIFGYLGSRHMAGMS
jgi:3-oxosteroid 1-dehydrogenase